MQINLFMLKRVALEEQDVKEKEETEQEKDIKEYLIKIYMSILPHQHQNIKPGHPCQPPIKNYIYNAQRKDIKYLLNSLKSIKELSNVMGEYGTKELLFLMFRITPKAKIFLKMQLSIKRPKS